MYACLGADRCREDDSRHDDRERKISDGQAQNGDNDLTAELMELMDEQEKLECYSDDLIEDIAGGPLQHSVGNYSQVQSNDENLLGGMDSSQQRDDSGAKFEEGDSNSSEGRGILDRLEGKLSFSQIEYSNRRENLLSPLSIDLKMEFSSRTNKFTKKTALSSLHQKQD